MRLASAAILTLALAACGGDDGPDSACARWDDVQGSQITDTEAVDALNEIADDAETRPVRDAATDLAVLLQGTATQTEVHAAYEDLDAACQVS